MMVQFSRAFSLVQTGEAGLACNGDGLALGPILLCEVIPDAKGRRHYHLCPLEEIRSAINLAYDSELDEVDRRCRGLQRVAELLTAGENAQGRIHAVLLAFPEISPRGMARLVATKALKKINPRWVDEPRVPAGQAGGGEWTSDDNDGWRSGNIAYEPAAARAFATGADKERFVDAHLAGAQKIADQLGVPVENILGLSAFESGWGTSPFSVQGNNFFGIHYPAPFASGFMIAANGIKVATFASYADSLRSFAAIAGSIVQGKSEPTSFVSALQNSGKFGIDTSDGTKDTTYVGKVGSTIRGIRSIVARRRS